ncbi:RING finger protein [Halotydeus destructor]|nr:RING finger protein [Halotydeus destructor]
MVEEHSMQQLQSVKNMSKRRHETLGRVHPYLQTVEPSTYGSSVTFEETRAVIQSELQCPICHDMVKRTYITPCSHIFCKSCILEWLQRNPTCPTCRKFTLVANVHRVAQLDKVIRSLLNPAAASRNKSSEPASSFVESGTSLETVISQFSLVNLHQATKQMTKLETQSAPPVQPEFGQQKSSKEVTLELEIKQCKETIIGLSGIIHDLTNRQK